MIRSLLPLLVATALLAGCAPREAPADSAHVAPAPSGEDARTTGVVRVVGSAPVNVQVVLESADGETLRLVGPLREELARLSGVEVAVEGSRAPSPDPMSAAELTVTAYEPLRVDGAPVLSGVIESVGGGTARMRTSAGEEIELSNAPERFEVGQRVWVQGPRSVVVQSYGVIRP